MTSWRDDVDGGKAWMILAASILGGVLISFVMYANGVIHPVLVEHFQAEDSQVATVSALNLGLLNLLGPLAGFVAVRWGCRTCACVGAVLLPVGLTASFFATSVPLLIFTYGGVVGIGQAFVLNPLIAMVGHYFDKFRPFAAGVCASGASVGMFVSGPLVQFLLDRYGLYDMFLIFAAFSLNWIPVIMLFGQSPVERRIRQERIILIRPEKDFKMPESAVRLPEQKKWTRLYLRNVPLLWYVLSCFFWSFGESIVLVYLKSFAMDCGSSAVQAANLFLAAGISGIFSKVLVGFAANDNLVGPWLLHFSMLGIMGLLTLAFPLYGGSYEAQVAYAVSYGLFISSLNTLITPINSLLVGVSHLGPAFGVTCMAAGVAYLIAPPLAGLTRYIDSGYSSTIYLSGVSYLLSSLCGALAFISAQRSHITKERETETFISAQDSHITKERETEAFISAQDSHITKERETEAFISAQDSHITEERETEAFISAQDSPITKERETETFISAQDSHITEEGETEAFISAQDSHITEERETETFISAQDSHITEERETETFISAQNSTSRKQQKL